MRCVLVGNFGVGNLGDEALKEFFLEEFSDIDWTVVSSSPSPGEVSRLPGGVRSLLGFKWLKTVRAIRNADAVVFGGGSLFTDTESVYACFLWWVHATFARLLGKKVHFTFQGIGPFRTRLGAWFSRASMRGGESLSVRDSLSYERVKNWGLKQKCVQSFDPVFSLLSKKNLHTDTQNVLTLIPRKNSSVKFTEAAQKAFESSTFDGVRIVSMQPENISESKFVSQLSSTYSAEVRKVNTLETLLLALEGSALVVSERYHGALASKALGIDTIVVSQSDGDKLASLSDACQFGLKEVKQGVEALRKALDIE